MFEKYMNRERFLYKKSYIKRRLQNDVLEDGVAYIPCKVNGIDDILSKYSVEGCESLDTEFLIFIGDFIEFVPPEYPVVLKIIGPSFSEKEKKIICDTIEGEMAYLLGRTEYFLFRKKKIFFGMIVGTIISGTILGIAKKCTVDVPLEFFYVLFWLFADAFVRYLFIEKLDFREEKIRVGRMASLKIEFEELG